MSGFRKTESKSSFQTHLPRKSGQISWNVSKSTRQENRWKKRIGKRVRTEVRDCLQTEEKFRYVLDSRSSMGRVSWDDLKLEEKSGVSVNRKDLEQLIESTGSKKQVEWYSGLTVPQRKLLPWA